MPKSPPCFTLLDLRSGLSTLLWLGACALALAACSQPSSHRTALGWERVDLPVKASLRGMSVPRPAVVWVGGSGGALYRSIDGGQSWSQVAPPDADTLDFRDIEAFDARRAVVMSAGPGASSRVFRTEDGGATWQETLRNASPRGFFNAMAFWDEGRGLLAGDPIDEYPYLLETWDGGRNWQRIPVDSLPRVDSLEYGFAASGSHLQVAPPDLAWLATGGARARVLRTAGGTHWRAAPTPVLQGQPSSGIFSLAFRDPLHGLAVGGDYQAPADHRQTLAFTRDGGQTWTLPPASASLPYRSAVIASSSGWIAAGTTGSDHLSWDGKTRRVIDSLSWNTLAQSPGGEEIWVAGAEGKVGKMQQGFAE